MKITILTEAGGNIGFGHLTRCIALYQAIEEKGYSPELIVNGDESILDFIKNKKYQIFNWLEDEKKTKELVGKSEFVIIDSYLAEKSLYDKISDIADGRLLMIDDDSRIDYPKGIVVNPSIYGDKLRYPKKEDVKYLLGKDYIILRREFWDVPEKIINKEVRNILVTFGGISKRKMRNEIIEYLNSRFNFNFTVVNPWENKLTALQMLGLMLKADICVSAGGQTTYELARMGVPTIGICFFENQRLNLEGWQEKGYIEYIGWCNEKDLLKKIEDAIIKLESHKERIRRSQIGRNYVDGKGVKRIVYKIVGDSQ